MKVLEQKQAAAWMVIFAIFGTGSVRAGTNVWTRLGPESGAVTSLAIDPQIQGTVYAATGAGLFKSVDEGASWSAVNAGLPCCFSTVLINPQGPATIYAVSGGYGIFRSPDGGANWNAVNSGLPVDDGGNYGITSLAIDPQTPTTLYAGSALTGGGVFKTMDGGASWNAVNAGLPDAGVMALAIDPQNPGTIYASTRTSGVFQSTDGGASWNAVNSGLDITITRGYDYISALAIDPQNPNTVYAAGHNVLDDVESDYYGLFRTTDAGASWIGMLFSKVTALAIDPRNPDTVYVGTYGGVLKSTDGGAHWMAVKLRLTTDTNGPLVISALAIDPRSPDAVYAAATYTGIFKTTDAGANWTAVNSDLRATAPTSVIALRTDPQYPGTIYAGTDAGVFKTTDAGANWTGVNAGLPNGPNGHLPISILEIDSQASAIYALDPCCQDTFRSTDGGASWTAALAREPSGLVVRGTRLNASALAIDPRNSRTLYAAGSFGQCCPTNGGDGVLKSTDGGASWTAVSSGLPGPSPMGGPFGTTLAIDPQNSSTVYAGIGGFGFGANSAVFKTTNGGGSWRSAGLAGYSRVDILAIDPQNPSTVYARAVVWPPYQNGCCGWLFKTTNGGASWTQLTSGLPNYVTALAIDPQNPRTLYAGSRSGVFSSTDGGANWNAVNSGLTLSITTLAVDRQNPGTVYAGTAGGVFAITFVP